MEAHICAVTENIAFQDNQSDNHGATLKEKKGKSSSNKQTKLINIQYYFVTDRIGEGNSE